MARRKTKKPQPEDAPVLLDAPVLKTKRRINSYVSPALLFLITFTVGASIMGWFCMQQQHSIDQLSESFTAMQQRVTNFQQVMEMTEAQSDGDLSVEERIFALEEAQKLAQEQAKVTLATSEKVKNSDLFSQLLALHAEMDTRWEEMKQATLSVTTLQGLFKNQSEELEVMKERVMAGLSSSSALSETVDGLISACSRVIEQAATVEGLNTQLEGQAFELNVLKELLYLHNVALSAHNQEMAAIKEAFKAKQVKRAQALDEMLSSVQMTLDEQFVTSQTLHNSVKAQLQTFHSQLANEPSWPIKHKPDEEGLAPEELVSTTTQSATELLETPEDVKENAEQDDIEDEAEEQAEEETIEDEQTLEQNVDRDDREEQAKEEITLEEKIEDEIVEQGKKKEDGEETAEEEVAEETIADHILDESLDEGESEEVVEGWDSVEEESAELNTQISIDTHEEEE